jgi:RsiW-degrading membrane proteinase PrsW (M82 family)
VSAPAGWALVVLAAVLFLVCAVITLGTIALVGRGALATAGFGHVLASVTIPLVPALGVSVVVALLDRYEREPIPLLLAAFLWGAVIAIPPVLFVERQVSAAVLTHLSGSSLDGALARALAQALNAGITEEAIKGAGLLLLLWALRDEFDNVTDGVLYGALIGAGFAMVENFVYFAVSPRGDLGFLILGRIVLGWLSHSTFTACFGAGLGFAREARSGRGRRWLAPLLGFATGLFLHTFFDTVAFVSDALAQHGSTMSPGPAMVGLLLEYGPLFAAEVVLLRMVLASLAREAEIVRAYLADEVMAGIVTPDEYALTQNAALRAAAEHHYGLAYGPRAYLTARALYQAATGLAFRKWHVAQGDEPKRGLRQPEQDYRARIARVRRSLLRQVRARHSSSSNGTS